MTNMLLIAILLVHLTVCVGLAYAFLRLRKAFNGVKDAFLTFVSPPAEGQPSPLANATEAIAGQFARAATASVKTTLMGMASGEAREALAAHTEQARQGGLGGMLDLVPSLKKKKYAGLLDMAMAFMASRGNGHQPDPGATASYSPKFQL